MLARLLFVPLSVALFSFCHVHSLQANTSSSYGDPTLTIIGARRALAGRIRLASQLRFHNKGLGPESNKTNIRQNHLLLGFAVGFTDLLALSASFPWIWTEVQQPQGAQQQTSTFGDFEIATKLYLYSNKDDNAQHLAGLLTSLTIPTAPFLQTQNHQPMEADAQPGTGTWITAGGLWYGYYRFPWSVYTSVSTHLPTIGHRTRVKGLTIIGSLFANYQLTGKIGVHLGLDARHTKPSKLSDTTQRDPGGTLLTVSPGLAISPAQDLLLHVTYRLPALSNLPGNRSESPTWVTGISYDL